MTIKMLPVADLSKTEREQDQAKIADLCKAYGPDESEIDWSEQPCIVATEDGEILDGHHRYEAFIRLGYKRCRVLVVDAGFLARVQAVGLQSAVKEAADEVGCPYTWAAA